MTSEKCLFSKFLQIKVGASCTGSVEIILIIKETFLNGQKNHPRNVKKVVNSVCFNIENFKNLLGFFHTN